MDLRPGDKSIQQARASEIRVCVSLAEQLKETDDIVFRWEIGQAALALSDLFRQLRLFPFEVQQFAFRGFCKDAGQDRVHDVPFLRLCLCEGCAKDIQIRICAEFILVEYRLVRHPPDGIVGKHIVPYGPADRILQLVPGEAALVAFVGAMPVARVIEAEFT